MAWYSEISARDETKAGQTQGDSFVQYQGNRKMIASLEYLGMLDFQTQYKKPYFAPVLRSHLIWVHHCSLQNAEHIQAFMEQICS